MENILTRIREKTFSDRVTVYEMKESLITFGRQPLFKISPLTTSSNVNARASCSDKDILKTQ